MKVAFHFENEVSQLVVTPESPREERFMSLLVDNRPSVKIKATINSTLVLEFIEPEREDGKGNHSN